MTADRKPFTPSDADVEAYPVRMLNYMAVCNGLVIHDGTNFRVRRTNAVVPADSHDGLALAWLLDMKQIDVGLVYPVEADHSGENSTQYALNGGLVTDQIYNAHLTEEDKP